MAALDLIRCRLAIRGVLDGFLDALAEFPDSLLQRLGRLIHFLQPLIDGGSSGFHRSVADIEIAHHGKKADTQRSQDSAKQTHRLLLRLAGSGRIIAIGRALDRVAGRLHDFISGLDNRISGLAQQPVH